MGLAHCWQALQDRTSQQVTWSQVCLDDSVHHSEAAAYGTCAHLLSCPAKA